MFGSSKNGKNGGKYFDGFKEMCGYSVDAAEFLKEILNDYDPDQIQQRREKMHAIEHDGDVARHTLFRALGKESKLPIEREDIIAMAEAIDDVTDSVEDVLLCLYMFNIKEIRSDMFAIADVMIRIIGVLKDAVDEFPEFRVSKTIHEKLVEINRLEEKADKLYIEAVRGLYAGEPLPPTEVTAWTQIFAYTEEVADAAEDAADVIESVMMKNA
jgi:predicted phosphate transport protein (TIGR00153 family)